MALLAWFDYLASRDSRQNAAQLRDRRAAESARLLVAALSQDMRAVQTRVLASAQWRDFSLRSPQEVTLLAASAFARYPYPDAFLVSERGRGLDTLVFFTRTDRPPVWSRGAESALYPVQMMTDDGTAAAILSRVMADAADGWPFSIFATELRGTVYQVVVRLHYDDPLRRTVGNVAGFMVNTDWARRHYFAELTQQIENISGRDPNFALGILDDSGADVVEARSLPKSRVLVRREFPVAFFDPALVAVNPPRQLNLSRWQVLVRGTADPTGAASDLAVFLTATAAVLFAVGSVTTARTVRAAAALADLRAEFMSSVTHELKAPIGSIRALGQTLKSGRLPDATAQREYGALVVEEAKRLTRLVDNLLAHARITDVADIYSFEPLHVDAVVEAALRGFRYQLEQSAFEMTVEIDPGLPTVLADQTALGLVLDNIIDNAIRYSDTRKVLLIGAVRHGGVVAVTVADRGTGIAKGDIGRVTQKFFRGSNARAGGSGLGLAIAERIVADHHGRLLIESVPHEGTTVTLEIPVAELEHGGGAAAVRIAQRSH